MSSPDQALEQAEFAKPVLDGRVSIFISSSHLDEPQEVVVPAEVRGDIIGFPPQALADLAMGLGPNDRIWIRRPDVPEPRSSFIDGRLVVDRGAHAAVVDGDTRSFPKREFSVLTYLLDNAGIYKSAAEIYDYCWGPASDARHGNALRVTISTMRERLKPLGGYIVNKIGVGYMFDEDRPAERPRS